MDKEQEVVVTDEAAAAEQAAFLAEMAADPEESADAKAPEAKEVVAEQKQEEQAASAEEQKAEVQPSTEDQVKSLTEQIAKLQKAIDTTNGTYGARLAEQQKVIEQLQQQRSQAVGTLTKDKFTRLSAEFPELAELLAEDLSGVIGSGGSSIDPAQLEQQLLPKVEERLAKAEQARELRDLSKRHKDWREVAMFTVGEGDSVNWLNPKFGEYVKTLPQDEQQKLVGSFDSEFVAEKLDGFKAWQKPASVPKKDSSKKLEAALLPSGKGTASAQSTLDEEEAAFRAEMASR